MKVAYKTCLRAFKLAYVLVTALNETLAFMLVYLMINWKIYVMVDWRVYSLDVMIALLDSIA